MDGWADGLGEIWRIRVEIGYRIKDWCVAESAEWTGTKNGGGTATDERVWSWYVRVVYGCRTSLTGEQSNAMSALYIGRVGSNRSVRG